MTELLSDPKHIRGDLQIIRTAIRRGYEIPDELLSALPKIAGALVLDKTQRGQVRLKAIQTIMAMHEYNQAAVEQPKQVEHHHTHDIGQVTKENIEAQRAKRFADLAGIVRDARGLCRV